MREIEGGVTAARGYKASGIACGIKKEVKDLALIFSDALATAAGLFTQNKVKAAPVLLSQRHIKSGRARAIIANSGNANCCTGKSGFLNALAMAQEAARHLSIPTEEVLVASTGVIGAKLPIENIKRAIPALVGKLDARGSSEAADAIMTTDKFQKTCALQYQAEGGIIKIGGIAKGAGMICPKMATMLAFITTDAAIEAAILREALARATAKSFNIISVDGEMSTNDTVLCLANGLSGAGAITGRGKELDDFQTALDNVCQKLARLMVEDGEGATKFITITVKNAATELDAINAAYAVAKSPLVKTAFHGGDPNWGRIMSALGGSGAQINPELISIRFSGVEVARGGSYLDEPWGKAAADALGQKEIEVSVDLNIGDKSASVWTTDLSEEYVRINSKYTT